MIQVGFKSDMGRVRSNNEDAIFILPEQRIYIVADGVGGHNSGELASRTAVSGIAEYVRAHPLAEDAGDETRRDYFALCLSEVNRKIYQMARGGTDNAGMATTTVLAQITDRKAYVVNVGDSRAYLLRDGRCMQVTVDHTFVNELLREGTITEEEAEVHPKRNMITRALGGEDRICPDFFQFEVFKDDLIILCSDGLYSEVPKEEMVRLALASESMRSLASDLAEAANQNGGHDNISVVCIRI